MVQGVFIAGTGGGADMSVRGFSPRWQSDGPIRRRHVYKMTRQARAGLCQYEVAACQNASVRGCSVSVRGYQYEVLEAEDSQSGGDTWHSQIRQNRSRRCVMTRLPLIEWFGLKVA